MIVKIVVVVVAIVSLALVVAMFTKKKYTLTREVTIRQSPQQVYEYMKLLKNQKSYSKWLSLDPDTKIGIKGGEDGTPGAVLTFESKSSKAGTGEWEITGLSEGKKVDFELRFLAPYQFTANGHFAVQPVGADLTKLVWVYNSGMDWPKNFVLLFMDMDKIIGGDIAESLGKVKQNLEMNRN